MVYGLFNKYISSMSVVSKSVRKKITSLSIILKDDSRDNFPYLYPAIQEVTTMEVLLKTNVKEAGEVPILVPSAPIDETIMSHPPEGVSFFM
jgi:hypothetical protein